ncbi:MAG: methyltransferase domain-containing protein [Inhella sp.]
MPSTKRRTERAQRWVARQHWGGDDEPPGEPTSLHAERLDTIEQALLAAGVRSVADLGCGDGALVRRLMDRPRIERVVALDSDLGRLGRLERSLSPALLRGDRLRLVHGSFAANHAALAGVEAVAMVETIEHLAPTELSALEHQIFAVVCPALVLITTPNVEYNGLLGMAEGQMREAGHRFEWPRSRFRAWATGVALRRGYTVQTAGIGPEDVRVGCPTQWARFERDGPRSAIAPFGKPIRDALHGPIR